MASYVLTYDLSGGEDAAAYRPLIAELQRLGSFKYQFSAWLIASTSTADEIYRYFLKYLDRNDRLWVSELTTNWQGNTPGTAEWIKANPPRQ